MSMQSALSMLALRVQWACCVRACASLTAVLMARVCICRAASTFTKEAYFSGTCTTHACVSIANAAGTVRCPVAGVLRVRVRACASLTAVLLAVLMVRADGRY